jgi:VIT1/CCC1 family predicted Fe2+/Mn2+ transporter
MDTDRTIPDGAAARRAPTDTNPRNEAEGIGSLISGLLKDLQDLVRAEVQLAKTELKEDAAEISSAIGFIAGGALVGLVGFIFLMLALTYFLNRWFPEWVSALIVGAVLVIVAAALLASGRGKLSAANLKPEQTIATLKEDQEWAKRQINSVTK